MTHMAIEGKDVSAYQPDFSPAATDDFVIIKASEGTSYRNPDRAAQVARARAAGCVIGWYHYMHQGNVQAQANYFVATSGIADGDLLVCDWEGAKIPSCAEKDQFIAAVKALRPHSRVGLYCNVSTWKNVDTTNNCGDFLHIAYYSASAPPIKTPWTIWQYSDGNGQLDHNVANFPTRAAMKAWAAGLLPAPVVVRPAPVPAKPAPPAPPAPKPPTPPPPVPKPAPGSIIINGKSYPPLNAVYVVQAVKAQHGGYISRNTWYVQQWLRALHRYTSALDGQWGPVTQAAFDAYRRSLGWKGSDATGDVGLSSLTHLHDAAHGTIPVRP